MEFCERCGEHDIGLMMSMFNTQMICGSCISKERIHPDYERAREAEAAAIYRGDYNFRGIGKPNDL